MASGKRTTERKRAGRARQDEEGRESASTEHAYPGGGSTTGSDHPRQDADQRRGAGRKSST
jgi:hypothetical protein